MDQTTTGTDVTAKTAVDFNNQIQLPDLKDKSAGEITSAMWGISPALVQEISNMNRIYASKHGMFASVPIICRDKDCAYKDVCMVSSTSRKLGQRCPMEIAAILSRYEQWCMHFEIDTSGDAINPKDLVDATLIRDLVNIEIQMLRAENKIALNGDFMSQTLLDIDKKCQPYFGQIVSPETEFLMTLQDKKIKILNQLNSTRKDKAADKSKLNGSEAAIEIFQKVREMSQQKQQVINISDLDFTEEGEIIEVPDAVHELVGGEQDGSGTDDKESTECDNEGSRETGRGTVNPDIPEAF